MKKELTRRHVAIVNMPYLLLKTLIKYKCLDKFINNYLYQNKDDNTHIMIHLKCDDVIVVLLRSFIWRLTPEGMAFWQDFYRSLLKAVITEYKK